MTIETAFVDINGNRIKLDDRVPVKFRVSLRGDETSDPDMEGYTQATIQAWRNDSWSFVIVELTPIIDGIPVGVSEYTRSEYGSSPDWENDITMDTIIRDSVPYMISDCLAELRKFRKALNAVNLDK